MHLETINKLYLELSLVADAKTDREMRLENEIERLCSELRDLRRYSAGHHRDEESCRWLHALTIDIPHMIDVALKP